MQNLQPKIRRTDLFELGFHSITLYSKEQNSLSFLFLSMIVTQYTQIRREEALKNVKIKSESRSVCKTCALGTSSSSAFHSHRASFDPKSVAYTHRAWRDQNKLPIQPVSTRLRAGRVPLPNSVCGRKDPVTDWGLIWLRNGGLKRPLSLLYMRQGKSIVFYSIRLCFFSNSVLATYWNLRFKFMS